jgi:23S rRNA (guanosine2251-2'-O)-methyltransferase
MKKRKIRLLAFNVRSLWNVGSFFRTCDAFTVEKIYLCGYTGVPPRKEITKTAIGAEEFVPWEQYVDPLQIATQLKADGWQLVSLEITPEAVELMDFEPSDKVLLMVGHELTGVPDSLLSLSDATVKIPMLGTKESLNVAVAAGVALFHLRFSLNNRVLE